MYIHHCSLVETSTRPPLLDLTDRSRTIVKLTLWACGINPSSVRVKLGSSFNPFNNRWTVNLYWISFYKTKNDEPKFSRAVPEIRQLYTKTRQPRTQSVIFLEICQLCTKSVIFARNSPTLHAGLGRGRWDPQSGRGFQSGPTRGASWTRREMRCTPQPLWRQPRANL